MTFSSNKSDQFVFSSKFLRYGVYFMPTLKRALKILPLLEGIIKGNKVLPDWEHC